MSPRKVWVRQKDVFRSGVVLSDEPNSAQVEVDFGKEGKATVPTAQLYDRSEKLETPDDCCSLDVLNEPSVLHNLQRRYLKDEIYTFTSTVLLAVNPYRRIPELYSEKTRGEYSKLASLQSKPPHPYALADIAYRYLRYENQVIVISGESGAGKTETAKIVMECLADRSRTGKQMASDLQNKIMKGANPVFESLGNATTVRNGNSSRFGKYNTLKFNPVGSLVGTEVHSYLLESSRVVHFSECERTYHVFYELLAGASEETLQSMKLDSTKQYRLLHRKKMPPAREDRKNFEALASGLSLVGFSEERQQQIFRTLAGLIHLGEVSFTQISDEECKVTDKDVLRIGAELLGFDVAVMAQTLCERHVSVKQMDRVSVYKVKRTVREAQETLESLMKKIYERTFDFIVSSMNENMGGTNTDNVRHIGILDIYGFEQLKVNSFEQMCINLANERLQSFFVTNVLVAEQVVYKQEGLQWTPIDVQHSDATINSLTEVMTLLDNYGIMFASKQQKSPRALDEKFTEYVHQQLGGTCILEPKRGRAVALSLATNQGFVVKHYAGDVTYSTEGWLGKNNARLQYQMETLLRDSTEWLPAHLCDWEGCDRGSTPFTSVARKYLKDLQLLLDTLQGCTLRYIRCFKPNNKQVPHCFDATVVREQLVQSGTIELVKIMHMGYPHRCGFDDIKQKFLCKLPKDLQEQDARILLGGLMQVLGLKSSEWAVGLTRVFLKNGLLAVLDKLIGATGEEAVVMVNRLRSHLRRVKFVRCVNVVRITRWLPGYIRKQRLIQVKNGLVRCCQNLVRIQRWVRRARRRLRSEQVIKTIASLQTTTRLLLGLNRWRSRCRRAKILVDFVAALEGVQRRVIRAEQQRFFGVGMAALVERKQRVRTFARHALLVAKLRAYMGRRLRVRALFRPLVRYAWLKIYVGRYLVKVRARAERQRELQERISLKNELEAQKGEMLRLQEEFAALQRTREEEREQEAKKSATLEQLRVKAQQERDEEAKRAATLEDLRLREQRERAEEAKLLAEKLENAKKAAVVASAEKRAKKELEAPAVGPTMSSEMARLRAENARLKERVAVLPDGTDCPQMKGLMDEIELLRAQQAQRVREQTTLGVQYLMDENDRLKRRPDVPSSEVDRLVEENRVLKERGMLRHPSGCSLDDVRPTQKVSLLSDDEDISAISAMYREQNRELQKRLYNRSESGLTPIASPVPHRGVPSRQKRKNGHPVRDVHVFPTPTHELAGHHSSRSSHDAYGSPAKSRKSESPQRHKVATPSRASRSRRNSLERGTSPPWNPERSSLANTPSLIAHRTTPGLESLNEAFSNDGTPPTLYGHDASKTPTGLNSRPGYRTPPRKQSDGADHRMLLSPLSLDSASSTEKGRGTPNGHTHETSYSRFIMADEVRSRLRQPSIRRRL